jgi:hypothetical protein
MRTLIATLTALMLFAATPVAAGNDDNKILKKLDAIEKRLSKIEKAIDAGAALRPLFAENPDLSKDLAKQLEALKKVFKGRNSAKKSKKIEKNKPHNYLVVMKWSAGDGGKDIIGQQIIDIYCTIKNVTKKTISIVNGYVVFKDKLGAKMGEIRLEKDVNLSPNEEKVLGGSYKKIKVVSGPRTLVSTTKRLYGEEMKRLIGINKKHVDVSVDMDKLMFSDGEVVKF